MLSLVIVTALLFLATIVCVIYREKIVYFIVPVVFIILLDVLAYFTINLFLLFLFSASNMLSLRKSLLEKVTSENGIVIKDKDDE